MISFEASDDQKLMVESVAQFARTVLRPRIRETERHRALPEDVRKTAHELGLGLVALPESVGGAGLGLVSACLLEEELAFGDPAAPFALGGPGAFGMAVVELATNEQASALLAPFTGEEGHARFAAVAWGEPKPVREREGLGTVAVAEDGNFRLTGAKAYVVNADRADTFLVFAQLDEAKGWDGLAAFVVPRDAKGLTVLPRATTLGLDAASFGGIQLDAVLLPASARVGAELDPAGFRAALVRFFARHAVLVAARAVGLSRAAFEVTREYVDGRKAFGKAIGHFQAVAFTVADRATDVDAARGLVWRAASAWDAFDRARWSLPFEGDPQKAPPPPPEKDCLLFSAQAIATAHEAAMRCGDDGVQLHGGAGFMRDYPVEKFMRDAKQLALCTLTAEHADQLATAVTLGLPLDPALVLPTAESQNAFV